MSQYFNALFSRRPNEGWFRFGRYDVTTVDIMTALAVVTIFVYGLLGQGRWLDLVFFPTAVRDDLQVWRLVTWSTATEPDFFPILGVVFFWAFGQNVEGLMGRNRFAIWVVTVTVVPAAIMTGLGAVSTTLDQTTAAAGLNLIFLAAIWLYAATYPNVRWFDVVPLWGVAGLFTLLDILRYNGDGQRGMVVLTLVSIATALTAGRSLGFATGWPIPHIPVGISSGSRTTTKRSRPTPPRRPKRGGAAQRVVEGPWRTGPATGAPRPTAPPVGPSPADQLELDDLLDKIGANGMDSLSSAEKQRLNELSKRLRNR